MATLALFFVLGGGAYAASTLAPDSVGRRELKLHAVSTSRLGDRAVNNRTLSRAVYDELHAKAKPGSRGLTGAAGPAGPAGKPGADALGAAGPVGPAGKPGADALGAQRIDYDAAAVATPVAATILDMPGLKLGVGCQLSGGNVEATLGAISPEDALLEDSFSEDQGADLQSGGVASGGNVQIPLSANVQRILGGPVTSGGSGYDRVLATVVYHSSSRTIAVTVVTIANADTKRCSISGVATPAS